MFTRRFFLSALTSTFAVPAFAQSDASPTLKLAFVAPRAGDDYFNACREGMLQAATEVNGVQVSYLAPADGSPAAQAKMVDDLVAVRQDVIIIAALASEPVVLACQRAVQSGIKLVSIDQPLPPEVRHLQLATPDMSVAMAALLSIMNMAMQKSGEVAVLSSAPDDPLHLAKMKALNKEWLKPDYADLALVTTVFSGGSVQRSYAEALAVLQAYPNVRGIIAPQPGALVGASRAVMDLGRSGDVKVTGVGLPSRMASAVQSGVVPAFLTWSPVDVGYAAARIGIALAKNEAVILANAKVSSGRLGQLLVDESGTAAVGEILTIDATTLNKYADLF